MTDGYIKLHRKFMDWEWYKDTNTKVVFLDLLLNANYKDKNYRGNTIKKGQVLTSIPNISRNTGISIQSVKTALNHLKLTGEITCKLNGKLTVITLVKWEHYQFFKNNSTDNLTDSFTYNQPDDNLKEEKESRKEKEEYSSIYNYNQKERECGETATDKPFAHSQKHKFGNFKNVLLTDDEVEKLKEKLNDFDRCLEIFSTKLAMKDYNYKSHYLAMLNWFDKPFCERKNNTKSSSFTIDDIMKGVNNFD